MEEKRAVLLCGAGVGGALVLVGIILILAGTIDTTALIESVGGSVTSKTAEAASDSATIAIWAGVAALITGMAMFGVCVTKTRRHRSGTA